MPLQLVSQIDRFFGLTLSVKYVPVIVFTCELELCFFDTVYPIEACSYFVFGPFLIQIVD